MNKRCARCAEQKPLADFTSSPAGRGSKRQKIDCYCRPCRADYGREHYAANRRAYIEKASARTQRVFEERMARVVSFLENHPCADCGEKDVVVLEFDHLRDKEFNVAYGIRCLSWARVLKEIEKCEVVCANCHRRRTARRQGSMRSVLAGLNRPDGFGSM